MKDDGIDLTNIFSLFYLHKCKQSVHFWFEYLIQSVQEVTIKYAKE